MSSFYAKKKNIVKRDIHGEFFLIDISQNYLDDKCHLYELNAMGNYIWDLLDQYQSSFEIAGEIVQATIDDISFDAVFRDVTAFLNLIKEENFLEYTYEGDK